MLEGCVLIAASVYWRIVLHTNQAQISYIPLNIVHDILCTKNDDGIHKETYVFHKDMKNKVR